jgi:hypothetical protein
VFAIPYSDLTHLIKLYFRSKRCAFIGYSRNQKGYGCLDLQTNLVYISRNVLFYETQSPSKDLTASPCPALDTPHGSALPALSSILSSPILPLSCLITIGLDSSLPTSPLSDIHPSIPISNSLPTSTASLISSSPSLTLSPHDSLPNSDAPPISLSLNDHAASNPSIPSSPQHPPWMLTRS